MQKKYMYTLLIACLSLVFILGGCGEKNRDKTPEQELGGSPAKDAAETPAENPAPVATIEMEGGGIIKIELYPEIAPNTVNNFISLANAGYYDGLTFHRIMSGFMIQGGDPEGTGRGGPGYGIKGEFAANQFDNPLKHERGVISMARAQSYDSAGSQFFIMHETNAGLDQQYASFGKVIEGMEVVDQITQVETTGPERSTPVNPPVMKKVTVDTFGVVYDEPEKIVPTQ